MTDEPGFRSETLGTYEGPVTEWCCYEHGVLLRTSLREANGIGEPLWFCPVCRTELRPQLPLPVSSTGSGRDTDG